MRIKFAANYYPASPWNVTRTAQHFSAACLLIGSLSSVVVSFGLAAGANRSFQCIGMKTTPGETLASMCSVDLTRPRRLSTYTC